MEARRRRSVVWVGMERDVRARVSTAALLLLLVLLLVVVVVVVTVGDLLLHTNPVHLSGSYNTVCISKLNNQRLFLKKRRQRVRAQRAYTRGSRVPGTQRND